MSDLRILAQTIKGEAEGEPWDGKLAVGWVVKNRATRNKSSVTDECLKPFQFSCWNRDSNRLRAMALITETDASYAAAAVVLAGVEEDPTGGANHYYAEANILRKDEWPPKWAKDMVPTARIAGHVFLRED